MSIVLTDGIGNHHRPSLGSNKVRPERIAPREMPEGIDEEGSALDRTRLTARSLNAIELLWGSAAKRAHLLETDAYERLCRTRGIGKRSIAEIERAVLAWGLAGIGGKRDWGASSRKRLICRKRLDAVLRDVGPKDRRNR